MPMMTFDLEDGLPPVSFSLREADAERFMDFMAECHAALRKGEQPAEQEKACGNSHISPYGAQPEKASGELGKLVVETGATDSVEPTLREAADGLIEAGHEFWSACRRDAGGGAVRWLDCDDGTLVIFTRGEYRDTLLAGIDKLPGIPTIHFSDDGDEESGRPSLGAVAKVAESSQQAPSTAAQERAHLFACIQETGREMLVRTGPRAELEAERDRENAKGGDYFIRPLAHKGAQGGKA